MIELAPNHKIGLPVANPILLAGGSIGYGEAIHPGVDTAKLGAVTVGPILLHSRVGSAAPRLHPMEGGFVLDTGLQNRGLEATVRNFSRLWARIGCPVLVQIAELNARSLSRIVQRIEVIVGVAGIELLLPLDIDTRSLRTSLCAISESCDLPILVKLPLDRAVELAQTAVQCEVAGLVIGSAHAATDTKSGDNEPKASESMESNNSVKMGNLYGPVVFPQMLRVLQDVVGLGLDCSIIACGGIYSADHVRQALDAGAQAVQIDSALWLEPRLPERLLQAIR